MSRKLSIILLSGVICLLGITSALAMEYSESPMMRTRVAAGELPPVEERLPIEPFVAGLGVLIAEEDIDLEIGQYGGTLRLVYSNVGWSADTFIMNNEALLGGRGITVDGIMGTVVKDYDVSQDGKVFTFYMREGLKWSDGVPVTSEDVLFTFEDVLSNEKLFPIFPSFLRSGGKAAGEPVKLEVVDDYAFSLSFTEAYPGFSVQLAIAGWMHYSALLKPKHYLTQFHPTYTPMAELEPLIQEEALAEGEWWALFHLRDHTTWQISNSTAVGFPYLTPWIPVKETPTSISFERNPYYFKVDAEGNQLPYIDGIRAELVPDVAMVTMKVMAGEVDWIFGRTALKDIALYKEQEEAGGYRTVLLENHVSQPTIIFFNYTYPDPVWREVIGDIRFRTALNLATNQAEILDEIYYGFGEVPALPSAVYDPAEANRILDEMGMDKRDADGWRLGPDGETFVIPFEHGGERADFTPVVELLIDSWREIGIKTTLKVLDMQLYRSRATGNEMQATLFWTSHGIWRIYEDYLPWSGWWGMEWWRWWTTSGEVGEEPPAKIKRIFELAEIIKLGAPATPEDIELMDELYSAFADDLLYLPIVDNVKDPVIVSKNLGNVPHKGFAISACYSGEQFFFRQ